MSEKMYGTVLIKASKILDNLSDGKPKSVQTLSKETAINAPTVSKILSTLEYLSYVSRSSETNEFYLGPALAKYASVRTDATNLVNMTRSDLERLQSMVDETIHLAIPQRNKVVYVNKLEPKNQGIYMTSKIGMSRELYSSGIGKAVLGTYTEKELNSYLARKELKPFTPYTITNKAELISEVSKIKQLGYAIDDEEQEVGGYCVAIPIVNHDRAIAAVSVSLPKFRLTPAYRTKIINELNKTKDEIESKLQ